jgi:hypothetical protein
VSFADCRIIVAISSEPLSIFCLPTRRGWSQPDDEEESALIAGLEELAYQMQIRRTADGSDPKAGVLTALPRSEVEAILKDRLLYLARSASIIRGDEEVRFAHQLLQELLCGAIYQAGDRREAAEVNGDLAGWELVGADRVGGGR